MKLYAVAIFDNAIQAYHRPFFVSHTQAAVRSFIDEMRNTESEIAKHPADYDLYMVGTFDDGDGKFHTDNMPLIRGVDAPTGAK
ncbi:MAG: nonstructural protein [Microvirus sp.]|nr:MAG: nonstructural protein [Microvirus sp.]